MHEGDHGIIGDSHEEFDKKFGNGHHHEHDHHHDHHHHHDHPSSDRLVKMVAGIVVVALIGAFVYFKFL